MNNLTAAAAVGRDVSSKCNCSFHWHIRDSGQSVVQRTTPQQLGSSPRRQQQCRLP